MAKHKKNFVVFLRNFVFGTEDSLVSTVGLLSGIAAAGVNRQTVFLTGMVLVFVEAFSMAVGSFLSEESSEEYEKTKGQHQRMSLFASLIMFVSYFISGFIPLLPYAIFEKIPAFVISIALSLIALFVLGLISAYWVNKSPIRKAFEMMFLGGLAIAAGIVVGNLTTKL